MSAASLTEGTLFAGRYQIVRCIAAGGMGAVYEVTHVETQRRRALKVMHPQFLQSQELRDRFRQEARVAAHIESEFIVDVFDAGIDETTQMPFLVMELLRGDEIGRLLTKRGRFTPSEVVTYLYQASLALDKTHKAQIVHRDLKPENLFLTEREDGVPRVKILDFGIAKVVADSGTNVNATRSIGTPLYMAPEQFRPGHRVSPAADLYALSMMAYTLLVGKTYWAEEAAGGNVFAFAGVAMKGPPEPATARAHRAGAQLPPAFDAWFVRATAFQPEARYPTATATIVALAEALGVPAPGLAASGPQGPQGAVAAQTQVLGAGTGPLSASRPAISQSGAGASGPHAALQSSSPAMHGSGPQSGAGASGPYAALQSSSPVLHGSGPLTHASPAAPTRSNSPVLVGIAAGLAVCLIGAGAAAYWLWPRGAPPAEQQAAAAVIPAPEPTSATAPPTVMPAPEPPRPTASPVDAAPTSSPAPTAVASPPATARTAAPPPATPRPPPPAPTQKKAIHIRD